MSVIRSFLERRKLKCGKFTWDLLPLFECKTGLVLRVIFDRIISGEICEEQVKLKRTGAELWGLGPMQGPGKAGV